MATLEKRVLDLERTAPDKLPFRVIVHKIVDVGRLDAEGIRCTYQDREWHRADDESEDQFLEQVYEQIRSSIEPRCIPSVVLHPD